MTVIRVAYDLPGGKRATAKSECLGVRCDVIIAGVEREIVSADGTRLVARRTGDGIPIVMVHGSAGGLDSWDDIANLLADEFEVWVYARRGYPPSDEGQGPKTFADDVADAVAVASAVNGVPHLAGVSYGATTALHAAQHDAARFRSLAIFEPPLFAAGQKLIPVLAEYRGLVQEDRYGAAARLFAEQVAQVPAALLGPSPDPDADGTQTPGQAGEATGCLHDLEAMAADETDIHRWAAIDVPVLLMQGEQTWAPMPATMDALMAALPATTTRVVFKGESHFATHTAPGLFAETLRRFLHRHLA
jgi:pimeloyl-ACP methyl ester carboxylesterase